jgi:hypothetical protein
MWLIMRMWLSYTGGILIVCFDVSAMARDSWQGLNDCSRAEKYKTCHTASTCYHTQNCLCMPSPCSVCHLYSIPHNTTDTGLEAQTDPSNHLANDQICLDWHAISASAHSHMATSSPPPTAVAPHPTVVCVCAATPEQQCQQQDMAQCTNPGQRFHKGPQTQARQQPTATGIHWEISGMAGPAHPWQGRGTCALH